MISAIGEKLEAHGMTRRFKSVDAFFPRREVASTRKIRKRLSRVVLDGNSLSRCRLAPLARWRHARLLLFILMPNTNFTPDEEARLAALARYEILDSAPETSFNRLTQMAARLFNVPLALVSLIAADRQWFKSMSGDAARALVLRAHSSTHRADSDS